jgi:glucokinase
VTPAELVLAVDVGGTKLAVGLVARDGEIVRNARAATPAADAEAIWTTLSTLVDDVVAGVDPVGVGIGCGGPLRIATGEVSPLNIPAWRDFPLVEHLRTRFPGVPLRLHNDAVAMAVGEHWRGAGRGASNMLGVVVSTGVGGGLVIENRVVSGASGNAGHIGHMTVDPDGPVCPCGNVGCLEAVARGPAVVAWALDHGWAPTATPADGVALVADARSGDAAAIAALQRAGEALGAAVAGAAHLLELEVVVVGGGLAIGAGELIFGPTREAFLRRAHLDFAAKCAIVPAELGSDAGIVGAAALVLEPRYVVDADADS